MKKILKQIFVIAVSFMVILLLTSAAYGASNIAAEAEITMEKGKVCDRTGNLYTEPESELHQLR